MIPAYAILVAWGITYGVVQSTLLGVFRLAIVRAANRWTLLRWLEALVYCPYCTGFWAGVLVARVDGYSAASTFALAFAVPGSIALVRAFAPTFLEGDHNGERRIADQLDGGSSEPDGADDPEGAGAVDESEGAAPGTAGDPEDLTRRNTYVCGCADNFDARGRWSGRWSYCGRIGAAECAAPPLRDDHHEDA